jgi:hypothetical protein
MQSNPTSEADIVSAGPMVPVVIPGEPMRSPAPAEVTTEVARPQPLERPGQIIMEWNAR